MDASVKNPLIRQGQFTRMNEQSKEQYILNLKRKIAEGFYSTDTVISKIVDDLAPLFKENWESE